MSSRNVLATSDERLSHEEVLTRPAPAPVAARPAAPVPREELLVADARAGLTPSQMVERKLVSLLKNNPLPVSHLHTRRTTGRPG